MSHFTVLVLGKDVDTQLEKYDENERVPEYKRGEVSQEEKDRVLDYYQRNKNFVGTFEECYAQYGEDWDGNALKKDEDGVWCEFSTYNPLSKWDWFIVGGRWSGYFKLKPGVKPKLGEPGVFKNEAEAGHGDVAMKKDIDFEGMRTDAGIQAGKNYDEIIAIIGELPEIESWVSVRERITEIQEARSFYNSQPRVLALSQAGHNFVDSEDYSCTREEFIERARMGAVSSYAVVKDGVWYQKGDMGWWGLSSNEMSDNEWNVKFNELIESVPDDTLFTCVDAHI
jgi:hypothetical protein